MSASSPTLALVVADAVGALFEPAVALAVLAAAVTVVLLLAGLASERQDLAALAPPDRALQRQEIASRLWGALDALPFDQRTVIVLREIDGLSYEEIADSLSVAIGTVKSRLTRARQALRRELREVRP